MLANYLIGLREGLEAALVVSILVAYLVKIGPPRPAAAVWVGVGARGRRLARVRRAPDVRPERLTLRGPGGRSAGTLSIVAVGFVTWMIFWMARRPRVHARRAARPARRAADGGAVAVVVVAMLAVGREGLETALFLWAATQAAPARHRRPRCSAPCSASPTAVVLGYLIYRGALKLNLRVFFTWTGAVPDRRRRRRARLRRPRPAGGRASCRA